MRIWILLVVLSLSVVVACKSESESSSPDDPEKAKDTAVEPTPAPDASATADVPSGPDPAVVAAAILQTLPANALVYTGHIVEESGEAWLAVEDSPVLPAPVALPSGQCVPPHIDVEAFWRFPSSPAAVLALGATPQLLIWDHDRTCFVHSPVFILPELDSEPFMEVSTAAADALTVIQVDLFPESPGKEVVSIGVEGFRVDRGEGPGAIRTGRYGLPITRTDATAAHEPPRATWETLLSPVPKDAKWAETPPERGKDELEALDSRQLLEAAWDDAIPLVASTDYPSLDAVHPDVEYPTDDDDMADEEEAGDPDELVGDCYDVDEDDTFTLAVSNVNGGWLFTGTLTHLESADYCGESSHDAKEILRTHHLRLRDGRTITVAEAVENSESTASSGYQEESTAESDNNSHTTRFLVASALGSGEEDRESDTAPSSDAAFQLVRVHDQSRERSGDNSGMEAGEGEGCSSSSSSLGTVQTESTGWFVAHAGSEMGLEMFQPGAIAVEFTAEGDKKDAAEPFDSPRKVFEGKVFGDQELQLVATPLGVQILNADDTVLFDFPTTCPSEDWGGSGTSLSFLAEVEAIPLQNGTAQVHIDHTLGLETKTDTLECFQGRNLLLAPTGEVLDTYGTTTSFTAQAESCEAPPSDPP